MDHDIYRVLTIRTPNAETFEDVASDMVEKGYQIKNCGYVPGAWWAILEKPEEDNDNDD